MNLSKSIKFCTQSFLGWLCFTLLVTFVLVKLGFWQINRGYEAEQREQLFQQKTYVNPTDINWNLSQKEGRWIQTQGLLFSGKSLLLDNQVHQGQVGYRWLVPFQPDHRSEWILLDLGFIQAHGRQLPSLPTLKPRQSIEGQIYNFSHNPMNTSLYAEHGYPKRIQALIKTPLEQELQHMLAPYILRLDQLEHQKLINAYQPTSLSSSKHKGYAMQWFGLAGAFVILMTLYRRKSKERL